MKKIMHLAAMITISLLLQGNTLTPSFAGGASTGADNSTVNALLSYSWYYDPWLTDPVGTTQSISDELNRLRADYGGEFSFSSSPGLGLAPYEYGKFAHLTVVIYSNIPYYQ